MSEYRINHELTEGFGFITVQPPAFAEISQVLEDMPGKEALCVSPAERSGNDCSRIQYPSDGFDGGEVMIEGLQRLLSREGHDVVVGSKRYHSDIRSLGAA